MKARVHSLRQCSRSLQLRQAISYSRAISSRPALVMGQSHSIGGGRFSRNSLIIGCSRLVQHDQHPSGSFFDRCPARKRANPIEIARTAISEPRNRITPMGAPGLCVPKRNINMSGNVQIGTLFIFIQLGESVNGIHPAQSNRRNDVAYGRRFKALPTVGTPKRRPNSYDHEAAGCG